jgi:hypothetical protein
VGEAVPRDRPDTARHDEPDPGERVGVRRERDPERERSDQRPEDEQPVPEPHRCPGPDTRLERAAIEFAGGFRPVARDHRVGLDTREEAPEAEGSEIGPARLERGRDPGERVLVGLLGSRIRHVRLPDPRPKWV